MVHGVIPRNVENTGFILLHLTNSLGIMVLVKNLYTLIPGVVLVLVKGNECEKVKEWGMNRYDI